MNFKLKVWRQKDRQSPGTLVDYNAPDIPPPASLLEMLDIVNERLLLRGEDPIAFDSDCREGICGTCSLTVNGEAHGPDHPGAACELYMRKFRDGETIAAKVSHLTLLPQGEPERTRRVARMVHAMDTEGFGNCTNTYECEAVCPAEISASFIAKLNREYSRATLRRSAGESWSSA